MKNENRYLIMRRLNHQLRRLLRETMQRMTCPPSSSWQSGRERESESEKCEFIRSGLRFSGFGLG